MNKHIINPSEMLYKKLKSSGIDFFVSVPCKLLSGIIGFAEKDKDVIYTPVTREEEGLGILAGAYLAGRRPCILMQNSGLGNSINAIASLLNYYRMPAVLVLSHRGTAGEKIDAQKPMGSITKELLKTVDIVSYEIGDIDDLGQIDNGMKSVYEKGHTVAFLFPFSYWSKR